MRRNTGAIGMILSVLFLSLEIYGLKVLQALEKTSGAWWTSAWRYACEAPCAVALVLTSAVLLFSLYLFLTGGK